MATSLRLPLSADAASRIGASCGRGPAPPLIDQRQRLCWLRRLPARLGTGALWLGSCSLLGPAKLAVLLLAGGMVAPGLLWLDRQRSLEARLTTANPAASLAGALRWREAGLGSAPGSATRIPEEAWQGVAGLERAALASQLGLPEAQLFRARHAALCMVHHDEQGRIVALELPTPALPLPLPRPDAHPVG